MEKEIFDDGTLACLNIPPDRENKRFNCKEERQENLENSTFWIFDFFPDVPTKNGPRHLYMAKREKDADDKDAFKVFTGSTACKYILEKLAEMGKFPRRVTLRRGKKNSFYFE